MNTRLMAYLEKRAGAAGIVGDLLLGNTFAKLTRNRGGWSDRLAEKLLEHKSGGHKYFRASLSGLGAGGVLGAGTGAVGGNAAAGVLREAERASSLMGADPKKLALS